MKQNKWKLLLYTILASLLLIQFFKPEKNTSGEQNASLQQAYPCSPDIQRILEQACNDCHSNTTIYPWYAQIQPIAWWLAGHVNDGKKHLNFDEFLNYPLYRQFHKFEEIDEMVAVDEMPLESYTWMHTRAKLSADDKHLLISWTKAMRDTMRMRHDEEDLVKPVR